MTRQLSGHGGTPVNQNNRETQPMNKKHERSGTAGKVSALMPLHRSGSAKDLAREWRKGEGKRGGVVIVHEGEVSGWVNELRNPEAWEPGVLAVQEDGRIWRADGGNWEQGATSWKPYNFTIEDKPFEGGMGGMSQHPDMEIGFDD